MDVNFKDNDLKLLETSDSRSRFATNIVRGYRKVMNLIRAAKDERDFRALRSLNFEKLKGDRSHQHSFRITKQWRLIVEIERTESATSIIVLEIVDYH